MKERLLVFILIFLSTFLISSCNKNGSEKASNELNKILKPADLEDFYLSDNIQIKPDKLITNPTQKTVHFQYVLSNFTETQVRIYPREAFRIETNEHEEIHISKISTSTEEEENFRDMTNQEIELSPEGTINIRITIDKMDYNSFDSLRLFFKSPLSDKSVHFNYVVE
jgi:hypothetical protein